MRKITLLLTFLTTVTALFSTEPYRELYIQEYKHIAISEMHRVGIPASIKLAQAILESNAGKSTLAVSAKNHFGIKCGSKWKGSTFYRKDDDRNARGKLIKSCFRSFDHPTESFMEHSDFLVVQNPARYSFLFEYSTSDYTNWAYGLKKAGYATDPQYPQRLIQIIEEFQLYQYDNPGGITDVLVSAPRRPSQPSTTHTRQKPKKRNQPNVFADGSAGEISLSAFRTKVVAQLVNRVKITYATTGDNIGTVAIRTGVPVRKLVKYNDGIEGYNQSLEAGEKIYLEKKKKALKGAKKFHYVKDEDTMVGLSQEYGIQLDALYTMNAMPLTTEPAVGEKIRLKGKMGKGKHIKTRMLRIKNPEMVLTSGSFEEETPTIIIDEDKSEQKQSDIQNNEVLLDNQTLEPIIETKPSEILTPSKTVNVIWDTTPKVEEPKMTTYVVSNGDTLWNISQRFGTSVDTIKTLNNLSSNTIHINQKLRIQ